MKYDPFVRGQYPVGVRSSELHDASRATWRGELELWYPAAAHYRGHDLSPERQDRYKLLGSVEVTQEAVRDAEPAAATFPVVVFSHGMAGHRRQSTFFCTHLASHGYVVIAPDHEGNTLAELMTLAMRVRAQAVPAEIESVVESYVANRPRDVVQILDALGAGTLVPPCPVDAAHVAVAGHSFGGFTALVVAGRDARIGAVLALAPAGGEGPLASPVLSRQLNLGFQGRRVATLYLGLERDTLLPLAGIEQLYRRTAPLARMFTLPDSDHLHFCDRAEGSHEFFRNLPRFGFFGDLVARIPPFSELVAATHGYVFANALGLAQLDASLKHNADAQAFLDRQAVEAFSARGIAIRAL